MANARITMEELRAKSAQAEKTATTFEKSPTLNLTLGTEIVFRVKKVVSGKFKDQKGKPMDLVIVTDVRSVDASGKLASADMSGYLQSGLQGPRTSVTVKAGADARLPNFIVSRFAGQGIELHPNYVYGSKYVEDKKVPAGTFKVASAYALGTEYPDA